jgi:ribokinase
MSKVTVVGSYVVDLMSRAPHLPKPGETVLGGPFQMGPGGKGGNQAVAAARLGAEVTMVTKVGTDDFGKAAMNNFSKEKINTEYIIQDENEATGIALIAVDDSSENMIVVALGACGKITGEEVKAAEQEIAKSKVVLVQLETTIEAVTSAISLAKKHDVKVILNPAPYQEFPREILKDIDFITPNETEATQITGIEVIDEESALKAARILFELGTPNVIITLGKKGCLLYNQEHQGLFIDGFKVKAIDATGAGDAFNGGLAYGLSKGFNLTKAINYSNATAALSVQKVGTAPAMPTIDEVENLLQQVPTTD